MTNDSIVPMDSHYPLKASHSHKSQQRFTQSIISSSHLTPSLTPNTHRRPIYSLHPFHKAPQTQFLFSPSFLKKYIRMLLRGIITTRLPSPRIQFHPTTQTPTRNVAVSSQSPNSNKNIYPLSISDEILESRGFVLRRSAEGLNLDELNAVFVAVGFPRRDPEKIRVALEHTESVLWVEHRRTRRPVAFARATGDGVFNAIIWDVVVDPSFQGIGLGKAVMERLIEELLGKGICNIALYSEPRVLGFYRPLGFLADPDGIRGMVYSRKQKKKQ